MTFNEFSVYMSENLASKDSFYQKALEFQNEKNKKTPTRQTLERNETRSRRKRDVARYYEDDV